MTVAGRGAAAGPVAAVITIAGYGPRVPGQQSRTGASATGTDTGR